MKIGGCEFSDCFWVELPTLTAIDSTVVDQLPIYIFIYIILITQFHPSEHTLDPMG